MKKVVYCAAMVLENENGEILLAQRPKGKSFEGMWEFPGGKIEPNETPEAALVREAEEELGIVLHPERLLPLHFVSHAYDDFHLVMVVYHAVSWHGDLDAKEGQSLRWVPREDMADYLDKTPPADIPLMELLAEVA
jgi:8-oxo-dGTP diphosphatase